MKENLIRFCFLSDCLNILGEVTVTYWTKFNTKVFLVCGVVGLGYIFDDANSNDPKLRKCAVFDPFIFLVEFPPRI